MPSKKLMLWLVPLACGAALSAAPGMAAGAAHSMAAASAGPIRAAYESGDYARVATLLLAKAKTGDARAECGLGVLYEHGRGVQKDLTQAMAWYEKAAAQGNVRAENNLGFLYACGRAPGGINYLQARTWFNAAVEKGHSDWESALAWYNLGNLYLFGQGVKKDYAVAARDFEKAEALDNPYAANKLGFLYEHGLGVAKDLKKALSLYEQAAAKGYAGAEFNLGILYEKGRGVARDQAKALSLFLQAAAKGDNRAQARLGRLYELGRGVPKDLVKAYQWYALAAQNPRDHDGDGPKDRNRAREAMDRLGLVLSPAQLSAAQMPLPGEPQSQEKRP